MLDTSRHEPHTGRRDVQDQVLVRWSEDERFLAVGVDGTPIGVKHVLLTGEHVQAALEDAGHRPEPSSLDRLFDLDEVVRLSAAPRFVVWRCGSPPASVADEEGRLVDRAAPCPGRPTSRDVAVSVLRLVAPIGYRTLVDRRLTKPGVDEVASFADLLDRLEGRRGVGARELQDWVTARASGDRDAMVAAGAALSAGSCLDGPAYIRALGELDSETAVEHPGSSRSRGRSAVSRSTSSQGAVAL